MSKSNTFENELLLHIFSNSSIPKVGDGTGLPPAGTVGSLYLALHTATPGEAGTQDINEVSYTGYARVAVIRSGAGWTVVTNQVTLAANQSFGTRTNSGAAIEATFFSVGKESAGATDVLYFGALVGANLAYEATALTVGNTIFAPGSAYSADDRVVFFPGAESTLPGSITDGLILYIKTAPGSGIYTLSATQGGLEFDITADGACIVQRLSTITIAQNTTPQLTTGTKIVED